MRNLKNVFRTLGFIVLALMMLALAGCGTDTETPQQQLSTKTTETGTVTADDSGVVAENTAVSVPTGNALTIQTNTLLSTDAAGTDPVTGTIATTVSYSTNINDLPAAAMHLPDGASLAAFMDIDLGDVRFFSRPLKMTMNVAAGGASPDSIVAFYTFNPLTDEWEPVDDATVAQDGTAPLSIRHLSIYAAFKTQTPPPGKPSGSSATPGNEKVTVSWSAPQTGPAPTSYNIYYATEAGVNTTTAIKIEDVVSPYEVTGLANGTPYYFAITAVNDNGEGGLSSEVTATPDVSLQPPASPTGVSATAGSQSVTVLWATKLYATSYNIYYSSTLTTTADLLAFGTQYNVPATSPDPQPATQSVVISPLTAGTKYYFVVTSQNSVGESGGQTSPKNATPTP